MSSGRESAPSVPQPFDAAEGVTLPASTAGRPGFLSDTLIELGLAAREVVEEAVEQSRLLGQTPEQILVESGGITDEQLAIAIAERNGLPYVDLFKFRVDDGAARLIDSDTARRYRAVPIAFDGNAALVVALNDPLDALAVSDIGVITKSKVRAAVASDSGIEAVLATLPASKRRVRLSAHGPDGFAGARAAEPDEWTLSHSISSPDAAVMPDPMLEPPDPGPPSAAAPQSPDLETRIEEMVAAALAKRLESVPASAPAPAPAPVADEELERANEQLALTRAELEQAREATAQAREDAEQARAEVNALSIRIEQLEGAGQPAQPPQPSAEDSRLSSHLERVMRELEDESGSLA